MKIKRSTKDICYICGKPVTEKGALDRGGGRIGFDMKRGWYHGWCEDKLTKEEK